MMGIQQCETISAYSLCLENLTGDIHYNTLSGFWSLLPVKSPMEIQDHPLKIVQHYCLKQEAGT